MNIFNNTAKLQSLMDTINALPEAGSGGVELPELLNPANESEVLLNKEYINADGVKKSGTFTIDSELTTQDDLITQIQTALQNKASAAPIEPVLQSKTATPTTSVQTITPDTNYDGLSQVVVEAIQTQTKTVTPSAANKTVTPDTGKFLTSVTVNGDANLVSDNIKEGVSIFGVSGAYAGSGGSGGDGNETLDALMNGTITSYSNSTMTEVRGGLFLSCKQLTDVNMPMCSKVNMFAFDYCLELNNISFPACETVGEQAFAYCYNLPVADFPLCTKIDMSAFTRCSRLTSINFPNCPSIANYAFNYCPSLTDVSLPSCQILNNSVFSNCYALPTISLPAATTISAGVFNKCYNLKSLYLMGSSVCALKNSNAFLSTPIGGYSASAGTYGSIYVPASLLTSYQTATNWTYFSSRIVGV